MVIKDDFRYLNEFQKAELGPFWEESREKEHSLRRKAKELNNHNHSHVEHPINNQDWQSMVIDG